MKKLGLFIGMAAFLAAGMLFWGCDKMGRDDFMPPGQKESYQLILNNNIEGYPGYHLFYFKEPVCVNIEHMFCLDYFVNTNPKGKALPLNIEIYIKDKDDDDWINLFSQNKISDNGLGTICIDHTFSTVGNHELKYIIDGNGYSWEDDDGNDFPYEEEILVNVMNCDCSDSFAGEILGDPIKTTISYNHPQLGKIDRNALILTLEYSVTICEAVNDVTVQGGLSAGGPAGAIDVSCIPEGDGLFNPSNNVVRWSGLTFEAGETKTFTVTYTRQFTDCGPQEVSGDWKVFVDEEEPLLVLEPLIYEEEPCPEAE